MKTLMLSAAAASMAALASFTAYAHADPAETMAKAEESARLAAVLVYADWCGSCQVLDPKVKAVKTAAAVDGVTFVTLDYTARDDEAFFAAADEAGVGAPVRTFLAEKVKTGQLLLIDLDDGTVVGKVGKAMSEAEITAALAATAAVA